MFDKRNYYMIYNQKPENKKRRRELQKIRRQRPDVKHKMKEYAKEYAKEYRLKNKDKIKKYQKENKQKINLKKRQRYNTDVEYKKRIKKNYANYMKTQKGKLSNARRDKKYRESTKGKLAIARRGNKRKRNMKTISLMNNIFPLEIKIEYHHIHNWFIIPLPEITHQYVTGFNHKKHNENQIKKIYCIDIKQLFKC